MELEELRNEIALLTTYDDPILLQKYNTMFIDYYVGISFLQQKFAFGDGGIDIVFTWKDSLTGEKKASNCLWFELNSILYNLGAVINNFGTHTPIEGESIPVVSKKF